jgi:DHA2 family methylenomycin A resistance protein-like MFS transporter
VRVLGQGPPDPGIVMPSSSPTLTRRQIWTLAAVCFSQFMIQLDVTIVNVTLPSIQHALAVGPDRLVWIVDAYVLPLASLILVGGTLGDRFGRKRVFLVGFVAFTVFSAGCALSPDDDWLIVFRALQGVGAALLAPSSLSILTHAFPPATRPWAIGMWSMLSGLGFGMGPVVAGLLLRFSGWSAIFWVNVPIGLAGALVAARYVGESSNPHARRLDLPGAVLVSGALFFLTFALVRFGHRASDGGVVLPFLVAALLLGAGFLLRETRAAAPMLPLHFFRHAAFRVANIDFALAYAGLAATLFFVSLYFQNVRGWAPLQTGVSWLTMNVPFLVVASSAGRLQARFGARRVAIGGLTAGGIGILLFALLGTESTYLQAIPAYFLFGAGYGAAVPAISTVAMGALDVHHAGVASGVLNAARQVGTAVGLPALSALGAAAVGPSGWSDDASFVLAMRIAMIAAGSLVVGAALLTAVAQPADQPRDA